MYVCPVNRTQIYLDEVQQEALRQRATAEGRSVASLIREAVSRFLSPGGRSRKKDPFLAIAGKFAGGRGDSAERHDDHLYRRRKK